MSQPERTMTTRRVEHTFVPTNFGWRVVTLFGGTRLEPSLFAFTRKGAEWKARRLARHLRKMESRRFVVTE